MRARRESGLCPSTQQISDGWRTLWGNSGERFCLPGWKFVNSRVPLFLVLQKRGQSTCPDSTGVAKSEPRSHVRPKGIFMTFVGHVCVHGRLKINPRNPLLLCNWFSYHRSYSYRLMDTRWPVTAVCEKFMRSRSCFLEASSLTWNPIPHICARAPCPDSWLL